MVLSILFALTVIIAMIDVLVGIHRGIKFGLVRLGIWIAGTVVCLLLAKGVAQWLLLKLAKVPDMKLFTFDVFGKWMGEYTGTIGSHMSALTVSAFIPVVFVGLFLIAKPITWIIYLIVKQFIKKAAKKATAHNAAVDAVTAVKKSEMPDVTSVELEQPYDATFPGSAFKTEDGEEFGTFGIFPKETSSSTKEEKAKENIDSDPEAGDAFSILSRQDSLYEEDTEADNADDLQAEENTDIVSDGFNTPADETDDPESNETETDGFESMQMSADGFENLARASLLDTEKQDIEEKKNKPGPAKKVKPAKIKPVKEKKLKKKHSFALFLMDKTVLSSVLGGILGLFTALVACAVIASPVKELVKVIAETETAEPTVKLVSALTELDMQEVIDDAFSKNDKSIAVMPKDFKVIGDFSLRIEDFTEVCTDLDNSVLHQIYKYSGADCIAASIYNCLIPVTPEELKLEKRGVDTYNITETLRCYAGLIPELYDLIDTINDRDGLNVELIDKLDNIIKDVMDTDGKGAVLNAEDKLQLANGLLGRFNDIIEDSKVISPDLLFEYFEEYSDVKEGFEKAFDLMRRFCRAGILRD